MQLKIMHLWSADLTPPSSGVPADPENFSVGIRVSLSEIDQDGGEVFSFSVCSPSALAQVETGAFIQNTLVLNRFSWEAVQNRLEKLLLHCQSCQSWDEVMRSLCGYLHYDD